MISRHLVVNCEEVHGGSNTNYGVRKLANRGKRNDFGHETLTAELFHRRVERESMKVRVLTLRDTREDEGLRASHLIFQ